ncbi:MAG: hypothetical protein SV377_06890 [Halobacteria archaeon]|nr:hypothetical protein [Halobacteria archaeon]
MSFPAWTQTGGDRLRAAGRYTLMVVAGVILITTLWGGLARLGFPYSPVFPGAERNHGILMVGGFLGTLIGLERATALRLRWPWLVPLGGASGGVLLLLDYPLFGGILITFAGATMTAVFFYIYYKQSVPHNALLALSAFCLFVGSALWTVGWPVHRLVYWWMGFLVLTITAERLELNRVLVLDRFKKFSLIGGSLLFLGGLILSLGFHAYGNALTGLALVGLASWLLLFDIARRTASLGGKRAFVARSLLFGYVWLALGGILLMLFPTASSGYTYDSILHAVFLGFVFSMIFGHALTILPAVVDLPVSYHPLMYVPLVLLHFSVAVRLSANYLGAPGLRLGGGVLNALAIITFLLTSLGTVVLSSERSF